MPATTIPRFKQDFALLRRLGIRNYRLSLAWPRLHLDDGATMNAEGIDVAAVFLPQWRPTVSRRG